MRGVSGSARGARVRVQPQGARAAVAVVIHTEQRLKFSSSGRRSLLLRGRCGEDLLLLGWRRVSDREVNDLSAEEAAGDKPEGDGPLGARAQHAREAAGSG